MQRIVAAPHRNFAKAALLEFISPCAGQAVLLKQKNQNFGSSVAPGPCTTSQYATLRRKQINLFAWTLCDCSLFRKNSREFLRGGAVAKITCLSILMFWLKFEHTATMRCLGCYLKKLPKSLAPRRNELRYAQYNQRLNCCTLRYCSLIEKILWFFRGFWKLRF